MITSKYNVGDLVFMRSGYSRDNKNGKYAGAGYEDVPNKQYRILNIELNSAPKNGSGFCYFFHNHTNGVFEWVLYDISFIRNEKLIELGI